ncbi:hypothetical protein ACFV4K_12535 [Nocardia sp. NPDC059764]
MTWRSKSCLYQVPETSEPVVDEDPVLDPTRPASNGYSKTAGEVPLATD